MRIYQLFFLIPLLASCSMMPDWMGDTQSDPKLAGERIPVFAEELALHPDSRLEKTPVVLPPVGEPGHMPFSGDFAKHSTLDIGNGADGGYATAPSPLLAEGVLYTLDAKGNITSYQSDTLKKLWKATLVLGKKNKGLVGGGLAYAGGALFVTSGSQEIVALNAKDGKELWRKTVGNVVRAVPLCADGKLFVTTIDNHFYALDSRDGSVLWTHAGALETIGIVGTASPVFTAGLVIVPYSSGELYALRATTGEEIWVGNLAYNRANTGFSLNDIDASLVLKNGVLYAAGNAGLLYAVNAATGERLWHRELAVVRGLWPVGDFLYVLEGSGQIVCLLARDGSVKWVAQLPVNKKNDAKQAAVTVSGPVLAGEKLLITASNGKLFILSPYDGTILKEVSTPDGITIAPIVSGNMYLLNNKAKLTVF